MDGSMPLPANDVIRELFERKSVRAFSDEPVTREEELQILEAAIQAPTAGNEQLYSIIVVRDQAKKEALAVSCDNQPFIAKAPLIIAFCADVRRWYRGFCLAGSSPREPGVGDFLLAVEDTMIAAQNSVVAAHSLGVGSCYIGDILERCEEQARILCCPRWVVPVSVVVYGRPAAGQVRRAKPRRWPVESVVFEDAYSDPADSELVELLRAKLDDLAAFCARKWNSGFSREMTSSVARILGGFAREA